MNSPKGSDKKKRFIAFKEITMTKLVAITFILPWLIILALQVVNKYTGSSIDLSTELDASGVMAAVVASGYFARSGYDMYTGYKYGNYGGNNYESGLENEAYEQEILGNGSELGD